MTSLKPTTTATLPSAPSQSPHPSPQPPSPFEGQSEQSGLESSRGKPSFSKDGDPTLQQGTQGKQAEYQDRQKDITVEDVMTHVHNPESGGGISSTLDEHVNDGLADIADIDAVKERMDSDVRTSTGDSGSTSKHVSLADSHLEDEVFKSPPKIMRSESCAAEYGRVHGRQGILRSPHRSSMDCEGIKNRSKQGAEGVLASRNVLQSDGGTSNSLEDASFKGMPVRGDQAQLITGKSSSLDSPSTTSVNSHSRMKEGSRSLEERAGRHDMQAANMVSAKIFVSLKGTVPRGHRDSRTQRKL